MPHSFFDNPALLAPRHTVKDERADGSFVLRSPDALQPYARCVGEWLEHWAVATPDQLAFAERDKATQAWVNLSYAQLLRDVHAVAQGLLNLKLDARKPIVVLSDNSLDHLRLMLAAMHIGRAVCTVSSAYTRLAAGQYNKIHSILATLDPALVYASDAAVYGGALHHAPVKPHAMFSQGSDANPGALRFNDLLQTPATPDVQRAFEAITPDTHAKYLLTSGSTGQPKVVINTHRMLCANQQMLAQTIRFVAVHKPVLLDWLPWSHTFGGNHNIGLVLRNGGTMHIDDGKPMPGAIDATLRNLQDVQPTVHFNVPRGYDMMLPALEANPELARKFFGQLQMLFYAGSAMPQATWQRLEQAAAKVRSEPLFMTTSWGSTETAPANTFVTWALDQAGNIGLPMAGAEVKFVPNAGKLELRVRGPHIFPGYRDNDAATKAAFDDEGFYAMGDAGYLMDAHDPASGIVFNGRVAEDFKLTSGTWVSVGTLRVRVVSALAPWVQDIVITGHDRDEVGALVFATEAARQLPPSELTAKLRAALLALKAEGGGSSQVPMRLLVLPDTPSLAAGEITDKGYINQHAVLARRADDVVALYRDSHPRVISLR